MVAIADNNWRDDGYSMPSIKITPTDSVITEIKMSRNRKVSVETNCVYNDDHGIGKRNADSELMLERSLPVQSRHFRADFEQVEK